MEEKYTQMVKTATWLGDSIGKALAHAVLGGSEDQAEEGSSKEPLQRRGAGRAKGGLFRLRKTRTVADFVNELRGSSSDTRSMFPRTCLKAMSYALSSSRSFADSASSPR